MSDQPLNVGMGSRRPKKPRPVESKPPLEQSPFADEWSNKPFPVGSIVRMPTDVSQSDARVVALRDAGDRRIIEWMTGPSAGQRCVCQPRELSMVQHPGPRLIRKPDLTPAPPIVLNLPGMDHPRLEMQYPDPEDRAAHIEKRKTELDLRFGKDGWVDRGGAAPTVLQGDFAPEQFDHIIPGPASSRTLPTHLEGGPADGLAVKLSRKAASYAMPAAAPNGGAGGNQYAPARYVRTERHTPDGLRIFEFADYDVAEASAAAG